MRAASPNVEDVLELARVLLSQPNLPTGYQLTFRIGEIDEAVFEASQILPLGGLVDTQRVAPPMLTTIAGT